MHLLKVWLRHYFGFTTRESNGFLVLSVLLILVLISPILYSTISNKNEAISAEIDIIKADSILPTLQKTDKVYDSKKALFNFDPNTASEQDFIELGLPVFLAKRIVHYRQKGGRFKRKEDFAKIYGLREETYQRLLPYISLPEQNTKEMEKYVKKEWPKKEVHVSVLTDLNVADTGNLKKINGIGNVLASRIVKYRNSLGGFAQASQLYEVYGLDSAVVTKVLNSFVLNPSEIKKLRINSLPQDSLSKHPYIGRKSSKILVNYRNHHGRFNSAQDLINSQALDKEKLDKLLPYLEF